MKKESSSFDLLKFLAVGSLGTITNLIFFFFFVDIMEGDINTGAAGAFIFAAGQNYLLNHWWTFTSQMSDSPISLRGYIRFMFIALGGFGINLIILWLVILFFNPQWKVIAQALGIIGGTVFNYLGSKYWVFISRK